MLGFWKKKFVNILFFPHFFILFIFTNFNNRAQSIKEPAAIPIVQQNEGFSMEAVVCPEAQALRWVFSTKKPRKLADLTWC